MLCLVWLAVWFLRTALAEGLNLAAGILAETGWTDTAIDA